MVTQFAGNPTCVYSIHLMINLIFLWCLNFIITMHESWMNGSRELSPSSNNEKFNLILFAIRSFTFTLLCCDVIFRWEIFSDFFLSLFNILHACLRQSPANNLDALFCVVKGMIGYRASLVSQRKPWRKFLTSCWRTIPRAFWAFSFFFFFLRTEIEEVHAEMEMRHWIPIETCLAKFYA